MKANILEQTRSIPDHPLAAVLGGLLGGWIPYVSIRYSHGLGVFDWHDWHWLAVLGALMFSAVTVFEWTKASFDSWFKALGFTMVTETVMICSTDPWLHWPALGILVVINATNSAYLLSKDDLKPAAELPEPEAIEWPALPELLQPDPVSELATTLTKIRTAKRKQVTT